MWPRWSWVRRVQELCPAVGWEGIVGGFLPFHLLCSSHEIGSCSERGLGKALSLLYTPVEKYQWWNEWVFSVVVEVNCFIQDKLLTVAEICLVPTACYQKKTILLKRRDWNVIMHSSTISPSAIFLCKCSFCVSNWSNEVAFWMCSWWRGLQAVR